MLVEQEIRRSISAETNAEFSAETSAKFSADLFFTAIDFEYRAIYAAA